MRPVELSFMETEGREAGRRDVVLVVRTMLEKALEAARAPGATGARRPAVEAKGIMEAMALVDEAIVPELN